MIVYPGQTVTDSAGVPNPNLVRAAGHVAVIRYLSTDASKNIDGIDVNGVRTRPGELDSYLAAGLGVGLVWETSQLAPLRGAPGGSAAAVIALRQLRALGWPVDVDVGVAFDSSFPLPVRGLAHAYGRAFATGLAPYTVGGYGGDRTVSPLVDEGTLVAFWQASARSWSNQYPNPAAHIVQLLRQESLGTTVDVNVVQRPLRFHSLVPSQESDMPFVIVSHPLFLNAFELLSAAHLGTVYPKLSAAPGTIFDESDHAQQWTSVVRRSLVGRDDMVPRTGADAAQVKAVLDHIFQPIPSVSVSVDQSPVVAAINQGVGLIATAVTRPRTTTATTSTS